MGGAAALLQQQLLCCPSTTTSTVITSKPSVLCCTSIWHLYIERCTSMHSHSKDVTGRALDRGNQMVWSGDRTEDGMVIDLRQGLGWAWKWGLRWEWDGMEMEVGVGEGLSWA